MISGFIQPAYKLSYFITYILQFFLAGKLNFHEAISTNVFCIMCRYKMKLWKL